MEFLGWVFLILIVLYIFAKIKQKKRIQRAIAASYIVTMAQWEKANEIFPDHLKRNWKPNWFPHSSDLDKANFLLGIRNLLAQDGIPLPRSEYGNSVFDSLSLSAASAMEQCGGNLGSQAAYAAAKIKQLYYEKGASIFDA